MIGEANDGKPIYGKWEDTGKEPLLDACGGHWGFTPESPNEKVYHYHVQNQAPFVIGCFGPNPDNSLVTVEQCRELYPGCGDGDTFTSYDGKPYDPWCPCFDANGSNVGTAPLAVFSAGAITPPAAVPLNPVIFETQQTGADSCSGKCGTKAGSCWCDAACQGYGDCCADLATSCPGINAAPTASEGTSGAAEGSCVGACGGKSGQCYCDTSCITYGDCCGDAADVCPDVKVATDAQPMGASAVLSASNTQQQEQLKLLQELFAKLSAQAQAR
jgi:hypothetical protein